MATVGFVLPWELFCVKVSFWKTMPNVCGSPWQIVFCQALLFINNLICPNQHISIILTVWSHMILQKKYSSSQQEQSTSQSALWNRGWILGLGIWSISHTWGWDWGMVEGQRTPWKGTMANRGPTRLGCSSQTALLISASPCYWKNTYKISRRALQGSGTLAQGSTALLPS